MTFLELVNFVRNESGDTSSDLTTLSGVTGENLRFKNWVIRAWNEIQAMHDDWRWLRGDFSFTTTADDGSYTSAQAGISSRFRYWDRSYCTVYLTASGTDDQTELVWMDYEDFRATYLTGTQTSSRPLHFSIGTADELLIGPAPDSTLYTIAGKYGKARQELSADADEPELPDTDEHEVIAYRALRKYGRYEVAAEVLAEAKAMERTMLGRLRSKYLPAMQMAGPLT